MMYSVQMRIKYSQTAVFKLDDWGLEQATWYHEYCISQA